MATNPTRVPSLADYESWHLVLPRDDGGLLVELDLSMSGLQEADLATLDDGLCRGLEAMARLEAGAVANPDEGRQVGHYWLRAPGLAPSPEVEDAIVRSVEQVEAFALRVHGGELTPPDGGVFGKVILVGIGGSALGPMLLADVAQGAGGLPLTVLDNTDPDGIEGALARAGSLHDALVLVVSKSGGTAETRNGMLEVRAACAAEGVDFAGRAVAVTSAGSRLDQIAEAEGWVARFPMWDWVGGRTSLMAAVGLLPAALLGLDVRALLRGAAAMDQATRNKDPRANPAALLAAWWHREGGGTGARAMVALPYKDRLGLLGRYLQQLVMESLGKKLDRSGAEVHQGLAVYGNKGSTDQHAFVQQLRDGRHDFFALFVRVLQDRRGADLPVDDAGATAGDYLDGFWQGTRQALWEGGRHSATLTLASLDEQAFGAVVALFERAVGLYAELIDVNAYHQPGVEAGKKAAAEVLDLQGRLLAALGDTPRGVADLAAEVGGDALTAWDVLRHLAANNRCVATGPGPVLTVEGTGFARAKPGDAAGA